MPQFAANLTMLFTEVAALEMPGMPWCSASQMRW